MLGGSLGSKLAKSHHARPVQAICHCIWVTYFPGTVSLNSVSKWVAVLGALISISPSSPISPSGLAPLMAISG